jgi:hypothetical protein
MSNSGPIPGMSDSPGSAALVGWPVLSASRESLVMTPNA